MGNEGASSIDTIVARATAPGASALAIVRLDGPGVRAITEQLFHPSRGPSPTSRPRQAVFGRWIDPAHADVIDDGLTIFFARPASYTGNDLAEFHCHGGPIPSARLVQAALELGARLAEPGEFTRRAFLNGKMDLAQAEAVADLINAQTELAARVAGAQLAGGLSARIMAMREGLINLAAELEARIDFPEEDLEPEDRDRLAAAFVRALSEIDALRETHRRGRILREGARVALVGAPNAGKSSLLNALVRMERSIVTPHPGTTRDTIECTIDLRGIPLTLIDTAGLRDSRDPIEQMGIERARREIDRADLVVLVHDVSTGPLPADPSLLARAPDLIALNKIDLNSDSGVIPPVEPLSAGEDTLATPKQSTPPGIAISCTCGVGLSELESALSELLLAGQGASSEAGLAINLRHHALLEGARAALRAAREGFAAGHPPEFIMVDLREALDRIGEIVGLGAGEEILDRLFSRFCIGK